MMLAVAVFAGCALVFVLALIGRFCVLAFIDLVRDGEGGLE